MHIALSLRMHIQKSFRWSVFVFFILGATRAAHAAMPESPGDWDDWVRTQWNTQIAQSESFVETRWIQLSDCAERPEDVERRIFSELGEFTRLTRFGDVRYPAMALRWLLEPIEADDGIPLRQFAHQRADLLRGLNREKLELFSLTTAEYSDVLSRVGIWRRNQCEFFVLTTVMED